MKTIIRKSAIAASLIIALAASSFQATAQNSLIYRMAQNDAIGITVDNATGANYTVKDEKGNIVWKGTVKSDKTFYIPTRKLGKGNYRFFIGHMAIQQFSIQ